MSEEKLIDQIRETWRFHDRINLRLIDEIPETGMLATPMATKGRNVAQQLAHMHKVRVAWVRFNAPELASKLPRFERGASPGKTRLKAALRASGKAVDSLLLQSLAGDKKLKPFKRQPVRWMAYLISHESHHRGQIALALKQSGVRLPERVAIQELWQRWYWEKRS